MKEITLQVEDKIADAVSGNAKERGMSTPELLKYIIGEYVVRNINMINQMIEASRQITGEMEDFVNTLDKKLLKARASGGGLSCHNCTMKISEDDVEKGVCSACGAPIKELPTEDDKEQQ